MSPVVVIDEPEDSRRDASLKVLEVATGRRAALTLILRAARARTIRFVGGRGHGHEADLANLHSRVDRDRQIRHVRQLEGDVPVESGIDEPGCRMDEKSESPERTLALDTRDEIVGDGDALQRRPEHELARVEHERLPRINLHELGEVGEVLLHVDDGSRMVAKHTEKVGDLDVDRRWLDTRLVERFDDDATSRNGLANAVVGENHRSRTLVKVAPNGRGHGYSVAVRWYDFFDSAGVVQWQNISFPSK